MSIQEKYILARITNNYYYLRQDDLQERSKRDNQEEGRKEDYQGEAGGDTEQQK